MSHSNKQAKAFDAVDMDTSVDGEAIDVADVDAGSCQVAWSGANAVNAAVKLQSSHDGTNWDDVPSASVTLGTPSGSQSMQFTDVLYPWARLVYTKGGNSAGTMTTRYLFKSKK
jgi:hypothetical protein